MSWMTQQSLQSQLLSRSPSWPHAFVLHSHLHLLSADTAQPPGCSPHVCPVHWPEHGAWLGHSNSSPPPPSRPAPPGLPHSGPLAPDRPFSPLTLGSATGLVGAWRAVVRAGALLTFAYKAPAPGPLLPAWQGPVRSSQNRSHSHPAFCLQKNFSQKINSIREVRKHIRKGKLSSKTK